MDISKAIVLARPSSRWSLNGDTLDGLLWHGPGDAPTISELEDAWNNRAIEVPAAKMHQVKVWLARNGINPDTVPQLIASITQDGPERWEALARWNSEIPVPIDYPMTQLIWSHVQPTLNPQRTLQQAWEEVLAI